MECVLGAMRNDDGPLSSFLLSFLYSVSSLDCLITTFAETVA